MKKNKNKKQHWAQVKRKKETFFTKINYGKLLFRFLFLSFTVVTVYVFLFSGFLAIKNIEIEGVDDVLSLEVRTKVRTEVSTSITGNFFNLIPRNNLLLINSRKLKGDLKEKLKKIEDINMQKKFPDTIKIKIKERKKILVICSEENCFFVDGKGIAYTKADYFSEEQSGVMKIIYEGNGKIKEGDKVLDEKFVKFLIDVPEKIKEELNIGLLDEYRIKFRVSGEVAIQTDQGWDIYLTNRFPLEKSIRMLKILLDKQLTLKEINNLEYVDLRSENKIFYRMKGDAVKEKELLEKKKKENEAEKSNEDNGNENEQNSD